MPNNRTTAIRKCLLDILSKKTESSLNYLQERADSRKSVPGEVLYTDVLTELGFLERKGLISYLGHAIWRVTSKGMVHAGKADGGSK